MEKVIKLEILKFLNKNQFFSPFQFGFLRQRSTTTQLLSTLNDFYRSIENKSCVDVIYIDISKAFDSVPIELLLQKLKNIGINGKIHNFIKNFLSDRSFRVKISEQYSNSKNIYSGVPQGSVLGPLLFLIFINDLPNNLPKNVGIKMFADDIKIYIEHKNDKNRENLSSALEAINKWSKNNGLKISIEKTMVLYLGENNTKFTYFLDGEPLPETKCVRDLGILIDQKLSFSNHINKILKNSYFSCFQLLRALKTRKLETLISAYKSYIRPQLEYATEIWNPLKKENVRKIEAVQKFFTRKAFKKCGLVPMPYEERLNLCGIKTLEIRRKINDITTTFKILKKHTHLKPSNFFAVAKRAIRKPFLLQNRIYITKTKNNFFNRVINSWNLLPKNIMEINDPKKFREIAKGIIKQ